MLGRSASAALTSVGPTNTDAMSKQLRKDKEGAYAVNDKMAEVMLFFRGLNRFHFLLTK